MKAGEFRAFFAEVCPRLGLSAEGYRRTAGSVRKRVGRRLGELGLSDLAEYRRHLDAHPEEWRWLDARARITISRFARDAPLYKALVHQHLPAQAAGAEARGERHLRVWSAGCASGEEPYSLAIAWRLELQPRFPRLELALLATDADQTVLARARRGAYPAGALRELPVHWARAFERRGDEWWLGEEYRAAIEFQQADVRCQQPAGSFDVVLCRNLAFTYFDAPNQRKAAAGFAAALRPGGLLVLGRGEQLPAGCPAFRPLEPEVYVRTGAPGP